MYFHIVRLSSKNHRPEPINIGEWQRLVNNDPTLHWLSSGYLPEENKAAVYFASRQDVQGMDWQLNQQGAFSFQNTGLSQAHPYIQKIFEVAKLLNARVLEQPKAVFSIDSLVKHEPSMLTRKPAAKAIPVVSKAKDNKNLYGLSIVDVKPRRPQNVHRIKKRIQENSVVTRLNIRAKELHLGTSLQGDIVAPVPKSTSAQHYQVKNIWLELVAIKDAFYTFCVQTTFMIQLPDIVLFYKSGSKIVLDKTAIHLT
ncbi:hypothetical protein [Microscilla marina]|uniref:Uncharacterized protein n=1 Tax=Microscilla marina ATCC 23134 TaxID=313606 RepID=A1ZVD3_MICM2|nr:hypothetical protein [Microscilla marina]EAY25631.1 hypothetical protein M23134_07282 [Microscilla marina ATCC 23134]